MAAKETSTMKPNCQKTIGKLTDHAADPDLLDELAQLICAGLRRILPQQSSSLSSINRDSSVDFSPLTSGIARRKLRNRVGG